MLTPSSPHDIDELIRTAPSGYTARPRMPAAVAVGGVAATTLLYPWSPPAVTDPTEIPQPPADVAFGFATTLGPATAVPGSIPAAASRIAAAVPSGLRMCYHPLSPGLMLA